MSDITIEQVQNSTDPEWLSSIIALGQSDEITHAACSNIHTPPSVLKSILTGEDRAAAEVAASNPSAPPDFLCVLIETFDDSSWLVRNACRNPSTPTPALARVLDRMIDDTISRYAADNPNRPIRSALKWKMEFGANIQRDTKPSYLNPPKSYSIPAFKEWIGKDDSTKPS